MLTFTIQILYGKIHNGLKIFQPILYSALIYIDDILLFSGTQNEHRHLLNQFFDIIQSHGIMLSAKKSTIATHNIEFLRMTIKDGHYQPGKHIAQELIHFPDQNLSKGQIQQFLGIINYIRDFIPHVDYHTRQLSALLKKNPPYRLSLSCQNRQLSFSQHHEF